MFVVALWLAPVLPCASFCSVSVDVDVGVTERGVLLLLLLVVVVSVTPPGVPLPLPLAPPLLLPLKKLANKPCLDRFLVAAIVVGVLLRIGLCCID